jgi:hypothetical protein
MAVLVYGILYIVVIYMYSFILPYTGLTDMMFCLSFGTIHVLLGKGIQFPCRSVASTLDIFTGVDAPDLLM